MDVTHAITWNMRWARVYFCQVTGIGSVFWCWSHAKHAYTQVSSTRVPASGQLIPQTASIWLIAANISFISERVPVLILEDLFSISQSFAPLLCFSLWLKHSTTVWGFHAEFWLWCSDWPKCLGDWQPETVCTNLLQDDMKKIKHLLYGYIVLFLFNINRPDITVMVDWV